MMKEIKEDLKTGETYNFMNERLIPTVDFSNLNMQLFSLSFSS